MKIEKTCTFPFPVHAVWDALLDAHLVGACMPGVSQVEKTAEDRFKVTVTAKVGIVKPTFRLDVELLETEPVQRLRSRCTGEANGMLGSLRQTTEIRLKSTDDGGASMSVDAEVDVFGRLGTYGYGVFKGKAEEIWAMFVANLAAAIERRESHAQR
ncbi:MAG: CoxG family protein [Lautropia sp.]